MTPEEVIKFIHDEGVEIIDLKFTDVPGTLQHVGVPPNEVNEDLFAYGTGFDGSSIRGFQTIDESDMLIVPDASTANIDPVYKIKTLSLLCNIRDPLTGADYSRDPRNIAKKAEAHLKSTGIGDTSFWGPEAEFFIFDSASFSQDSHSSHHSVDSDEGIWNSGNEYMLDGKGRLLPVPPVDTLSDIRSEMVIEMQKFGMKIEKHHHEVATAGQGEIDIVYDTLVKTADNIMIYKYLVKNVAARHGKTATFMPKPLFDDNGTGMHTHQSIWKDGGRNAFYDAEDSERLSSVARHFIAGLLRHAREISAVTNQWVNSYKRLVPNFEAPVHVTWATVNRADLVRVPSYKPGREESRRVEFRSPDPACNPYLAFSVMLAAGLEGIEKKYELPDPTGADVFDMTDAERKAHGIESLPSNLLEALRITEESELVRNALGDSVFKSFVENKKIDWERYRSQVTDYEIARYLPTL
ncbi:Glutamine synthetase [Geodia barretti]|uniref:Glutamine synthetase n=1 Tax=Geodia barretti TaxID=519541 RepID=A0AA35WRH5_GEOBA|nr:Glutamine synthetase [Geodia barretti]